MEMMLEMGVAEELQIKFIKDVKHCNSVQLHKPVCVIITSLLCLCSPFYEVFYTVVIPVLGRFIWVYVKK